MLNNYFIDVLFSLKPYAHLSTNNFINVSENF